MLEFLHPAWLWALAALGVPLGLHLLQRRTTLPRDFPPAVLLEAGAARAARTRRLRELLLLAARVALLAAVVLCFSRPAMLAPPEEVKAADRPALGLVAVIDDSPSSGRPADPADARGPTRLSRGLAEAHTALEALGAGSEAAVLLASGRSLGPGEPAEVSSALAAFTAQARPSPLADMGRALAAAAEFLEAMRPLPGAVLVLGDCEAGSLPAEPLESLARRARLAGVDLGAAGTGDDWAILGARLAAPRLVAGEPATVLARVERAPAEGRPGPALRRLELVLDGVATAWQDLSLERGQETEVELEFSVAAGAHLGELRLAGADPWPANDHLPVAVAAAAPPRVTVIAERRELARAAESVRLALSAGPGAERKAFLADVIAGESVALTDLSASRAFLLVGPPRLPAAAAARLARAAAAGAGMVILASDPAALDELAVPLGLPVPAAAARVEELERPARLAPTEAGAALFAPFRGAAGSSCFRRALRLSAGGGRVLAQLRGAGPELPGLVEHSFGRAAVLVLASGPQQGWSDLAAREQAPLFVPLVHELAARAAGLAEAEIVAAPGATLELAASGRERGSRCWLLDAAGLRTPAGAPDAALRLHLAAPAWPGAFCLVSETEGLVAAERGLAVRLPAAELAGRRERAEHIAAFVAGSGAAMNWIEADRRAGRDLSGWLAAAALGLLVLELLAARLAPSPGPAAAEPPEVSAAREKRGRPAR